MEERCGALDAFIGCILRIFAKEGSVFFADFVCKVLKFGKRLYPCPIELVANSLMIIVLRLFGVPRSGKKMLQL